MGETYQWREGIDKEKRLRAPLRSRVHERVGLQVEGRGEVHVQLAVGADGQGRGRHEDVLGALIIENQDPTLQCSATAFPTTTSISAAARISGSHPTNSSRCRNSTKAPTDASMPANALNSLIQISLQRSLQEDILGTRDELSVSLQIVKYRTTIFTSQVPFRCNTFCNK